MFEITIDNKQYKFPTRLTVDKWQELARWDMQVEDHFPRLIAGLIDCDWRDLQDIELGQQQIMVGYCISLMNQRRDTKDNLDLATINFGQWIDLDVWTSEGFDKSIKKALTILGDTPWADEALQKIERWIDYRTWIYRQYAEMFGLLEEGEEDQEEDNDKPVDHNDIISGWYTIVCSLASENLLWIDSITEQPLLSTLNFMAYQKRKQIAENFQQLKKQREYDLQRRSR